MLFQSGRSLEGFRVRVLAGAAINQEIDGIQHIRPYSPRSVGEFKQIRSQMFRVERLNTQRSAKHIAS